MKDAIRLIAFLVLVGMVSGALAATGGDSWSIVKPSAGELVSGSYRANVSTPPNGTKRVEYWVDGAWVGEDRSCCNWSERFDAVVLADGEHTILAKAFDARSGGAEIGETQAVTFRTGAAGGDPPPPPLPAPQCSDGMDNDHDGKIDLNDPGCSSASDDDESDDPPPPPPTGGDTYPPPSTEASMGKFGLKCVLSHQKQVDPIVRPGPPGTLSHHLHDFFGNRSTDSNSTYGSMTATGTTCSFSGDTGAYWVPSLVRPDGTFVQPVAMYPTYRNVPVNYGTTTAFPADFRLIAGGAGSFPHFWWNCGADSSSTTQLETPPNCGSDRLIASLQFPNCWDGVNTDSPDHRSHVVYYENNKCPASHPVKVPKITIKVYYPKGESGPGYRLADGTTSMHADFWNTWQQSALENVVRDCLHAGIDCGRLQD